MNEGNEMGTETRVETEEVEAYKEPEVEEEGGVEMETEPPRGRTKAAAQIWGEGLGQFLLSGMMRFLLLMRRLFQGKINKGGFLQFSRAKMELLLGRSRSFAKEANEPATDKGAEGAENDPKPRGRPRKSTDPKKFTTPKQRTRTRSQWISSPYTEADTNEIEGRKKKKPRTEA
ncbi:hypothetical protein Bca4012_014281 [Brassica carinata]